MEQERRKTGRHSDGQSSTLNLRPRLPAPAHNRNPGEKNQSNFNRKARQGSRAGGRKASRQSSSVSKAGQCGPL